MTGTPTLTRLPSREERDRLRFIFGTMSIEELADMFDTVISKTEQDIGKLEADDPHDIKIGRRLHRLVNHLVLHPSGFFPKTTVWRMPCVVCSLMTAIPILQGSSPCLPSADSN